MKLLLIPVLALCLAMTSLAQEAVVTHTPEGCTVKVTVVVECPKQHQSCPKFHAPRHEEQAVWDQRLRNRQENGFHRAGRPDGKPEAGKPHGRRQMGPPSERKVFPGLYSMEPAPKPPVQKPVE